MGRVLITVGIILIAVGLLWPWAAKIGFGHLPGDIRVESKGFTFYFPLTSCIIVSLIVTVLLWIFRR